MTDFPLSACHCVMASTRFVTVVTHFVTLARHFVAIATHFVTLAKARVQKLRESVWFVGLDARLREHDDDADSDAFGPPQYLAGAES
jgi:hypothetical protein